MSFRVFFCVDLLLFLHRGYSANLKFDELQLRFVLELGPRLFGFCCFYAAEDENVTEEPPDDVGLPRHKCVG